MHKNVHVVHTQNGILLSQKKEENWVICKDVHRPRDCHTDGLSQKEKSKYPVLVHIHGI